jgi:hypothetical protein
VLVAGCVRQEAEKPPAGVEAQARAEAAGGLILAESTNRTPPWRVQVLSAERIAADTLRLEMVVSNLAATTASPAELAAFRDALAAIGGLSLLTSDRRRRLFPLHNSAGRMVWSGLAAPEPGQQRQLWVLFPAPTDAGLELTLVIPGFPPMRGLRVSKQK